MADVVICYAKDGEAAAAWLSGLLRADGFSIWSEAAARGPITDRIAGVRAAVVIWTEAARASDWIKAEANYARGQSKLVQAAVDAEPPPMPFDRDAVSPLAGFSGQEDHPGWLRIRGELEALCRRRGPPSAAAPPAAVAAATVAPPAARTPPAAASRRSSRGLGSVLGLLLALVVIGGAFLWMRSGPPFADEPSTTASPPAKTASPPPNADPPPPLTAEPQATLPPASFGAAPSGPGTGEGLAAPTPEPLSGAPDRRPESRPAPRPTGPRINPRNSRNMRLFCQRAGRGTPQCRRFQRQLRNQG